MSVLPPKADIRWSLWNVRFVPIGDNAPQQTAYLFNNLIGAVEE